MKKEAKLVCKILSVFLTVLLVLQIAPMQIIADAYHEATINENTDNTLGVSLDDIDTTEPEAEILAEETSKREQYVKHFRMSDGSYRATQYEVPVHFIQDGEWTDYDNTLVEVDADTEDGENASNKDLTNTLADYSVRLSKKTNGKKFVRIEKDGYKLSWNYSKANKVTAQITEITDDGDETTLEKLSSQVIYEEVYTDTDFEYIVGSDGLKENIILKSKDTQTVFEAEYKANGLTPVQIDDKTIELQADDGTVIYTISAPYMTDANGEYSNGITLTLSSVKNNKFTVTTTLDEDWLNDYDRAYPVTVDPIIQTEQKAAKMDSAFVASSYPDRNYYSYGQANGGADSGSMYVGKVTGYGQTESYLKFSPLPTLGVADKVINAVVSVYLIDCDLGLQVDLKQVKESWDNETITWSNKPESYSSIIDYVVLEDGEEPDWLNFEITDLVRCWYSGEYANYGISLSTTKTSLCKAYLLNSFFNEDNQTKARPILTVNYRNMSGYEDYWSYTGVSAGRNGAVSINNYNGNAVFAQPITLGDGGNLMPVSISLVYNSNGATAPYTQLGKNIQTNYHIYLKEENGKLKENGYRYYLNDADGTKHWFYFESSTATSGKDEDGLGYTLDVITEGSDTTYRITDKNKTKMYFDTIGNLIQITDTNGNSIEVTYASSPTRIQKITDGVGRDYTFNYGNTSNTSLCTSITDDAGRVVSFTYENNTLKTITFPDGETYTLTFSGALLTQVGAIDGTRTKITYDSTSQKRVSNINWGTSDTALLESYSFTYKQNETTITDKQSRKYTYQFNNLGQTTGIVSNTAGQAQYFDYYDTGETKADSRANKLVSESKVLHSVTNYVVDPGFHVTNLETYYDPRIQDTSDDAAITLDTTKGNLTDNSVKIYKPETNTGYIYIFQYVKNLSAGEYTLSAHVNTERQTISDGGVYLGYILFDADGNQIKAERAEKIFKTDGWERFSMPFKIEEGQYIRIQIGMQGDNGLAAHGTVWVDDIQVEKSSGMSSYNLLENSAFTNDKYHWSSQATLNTINDLPGFTKAISKVGSPTVKDLGLSQIIYESGKKDDVFSIGAWIKADSAPINNLKDNGEGEEDDDEYQPRFALALHFYKASSSIPFATEEIKVNDDLNTWQFVSGKVIAPEDYAKICFEVIYYCNVNTVMMTGGFCFKEEFGQTYTYDKDGNVISSVDLAKTQSNFAFKGDQMAKMLNPSGSRYMYSYDEDNNNLNYALSSDGQQYAFEYDNKGNVTSSEITARKPERYLEVDKEYYLVNAYSGKAFDSGSTGVNSDDVFTSSYDPTSKYQKWKLQALDDVEDGYRLISVAFPQYQLDISMGYDTDGRWAQLYTPHSASSQKFKITRNDDGTFSIYTNGTNYTKALDAQYDSNDIEEKQIIKQNTLPDGELKESMKWYFYPVEATEEKSISTSATYTENQNFVSTITDQRGNETTYAYNETKGTLTSITDASGNKTNYTYNENTNALTAVFSGGMRNFYTYSDDYLTDINVNNTTFYKFTYDGFGRTTGTWVGNGSSYRYLSQLVYNSNGLLSKQKYGNNDFIAFSYDSLDRLIGKSYNGSSTNRIEYFYGADGNISKTIDYSTNTRTKYVYDLAGRLVSTRDYVNGYSDHAGLKSYVEYTYANKTNYLTDITHYSELGTHNISFDYGDISRFAQMPDAIYRVYWNGLPKVWYTYDTLGRVTNKTVSNMPNEYSYIDVDDTHTTTLLSSLETVAGTYSYTYDEIGNITSINDGTYTTSYEYDALNQLVRENDQRAGKTYVYTYRNGNILTRKEYAYTTGELGDVISTKTWGYTNTQWRDLLTNWNGSTITYDAIGNPLSLNGLTMTWQGRQLQSLTKGDYVFDFAYNMEGQRVSKTFTNTVTGKTRTTEYYYCGDILAGEKSPGATIVFMFDNNGDYYGFTFNGTEYYYIKNAQNDVVAIADANKNIVVRYYYNAWGEIIDCEDETSFGLGDYNPITYRSYYRDGIVNTYMYYLNSRYYYPVMCRFLNADGLVQTGQGILDKNMFAYCANNPVMFRDPSGCSYIITMPAVGNGPAKSSGDYVVTCYKNNDGNYTYEPVPLTEDLKVFISTIAAEGTTTVKGTKVSSSGRRAMANVVLNRVGVGEWSKYKTVSEICAYTGFDGYDDDNYKACKKYLDARDGNNSTYETIIWDVMMAYNNDITGGCQLYYTPASMDPPGSKPNWNFDIISEVEISGVDPYYEGRFYRYN